MKQAKRGSKSVASARTGTNRSAKRLAVSTPVPATASTQPAAAMVATPPPPPSLGVLTALPADRHPVAVYLASLSSGSRRTMAHAVEVIASLVSSGRNDARTLPWQALRYQHVQFVRTALAAKFAPATANKMLAALRGVLREAWRLGLMPAEDFHRAIDIKRVTGTRLPRGRALNAGELRALFTALASDPSASAIRDAALLAVLYGAGVRRAEAASLLLSDYNPESGELKIRSGKGNKARLAYASNGSKDALDAWLVMRGAEPGPLFCPVLKGRSGKVQARAMTAGAIYFMLLRRAKKAGISKLSPHDLRRTFIGDLLDAGADISTVQALAGHSSPTTTARYDRRPEATKKKAAELLHVPFVARDAS